MKIQIFLGYILGAWLMITGAALAENYGPLPPDQRAQSAFSDDPHRQFDFWIGEWDVLLRERDADGEWKQLVTARDSIYSILNGKAILELWDSNTIKGYSLRYYDPALQKWVLWLNWPGKNRSSNSSLQGIFRHGRGDFASEYDLPNGDHMMQVYSFNDVSQNALRWDDRYSKDNGKTWSFNWIMEFSRRAVEPSVLNTRQAAPTFDDPVNGDGARCDDQHFRAYEKFAGSWEGSAKMGDKTVPASFSAHKVLGGCSVMGFMHVGEQSWFMLATWLTGAKQWEVSLLSDVRGEPLIRLFSDDDPMNVKSNAGAQLTFALEEGLAWELTIPTAIEGEPQTVTAVMKNKN